MIEFFDDFVAGVGLSTEERDRLSNRLGVEDEDLKEAKRIVAEVEAEIAKLNTESKKTSKKQKGPLLARIKELENEPLVCECCLSCIANGLFA